MAFRHALTQLAGLGVNGVQHNYDVDAVPESLSRAQLPALLVLPVEFEENALSQQRGGGFQTIAFSGGGATVEYRVTHLLLIAPAAAGKGLRSHLPALINGVDAYFSALSTDAMLGDTLAAPAEVRVEPGRFHYGGVEYVGCAFRHTWLLAV